MPPIDLTPEIIQSDSEDEDYYDEIDDDKMFNTNYTCPVYKSVIKEVSSRNERAYQKNYILSVKLPSLKSETTWVKRSVALFSSIDE